MDEENIVLDKKSFEALAGETRIKILKSLNSRQKTSTELAQELNLAVPSVKEHLDTLESSGFVQKMDDGHKWKYYFLTKKGKNLFSPNALKVMILLGISCVVSVLSAFALYFDSSSTVTQETFASKAAAPLAYEPLNIAAATATQAPSSFVEAPILQLVLLVSLLCVLGCTSILLYNSLSKK